MLEANWLTLDQDWEEIDNEVRTRVLNRELDLTDGNYIHPQLFPELALHRLEVGLPGFDLSAGELPQPAVPLVGRTKADEDLPVAFDHRGDDSNVHQLG